MERLICSSSSSSSSSSLVTSQILRKPTSPFLSRVGPIDSLKLGFPPPARTDLRQVNLISCRYEKPPPSSPVSPKSVDKLLSLSAGPVDSRKETVSPSQFLKQIVVGSSGQQKVMNSGKLDCVLVCVGLDASATGF